MNWYTPHPGVATHQESITYLLIQLETAGNHYFARIYLLLRNLQVFRIYRTA